MNRHEEQQHGTDSQPGYDYGPGGKVNLGNIPEELQALDRWVCWQHASRAGKLTKVPKNPKHPIRNAAVDDPSTWGTFEQAVKTYNRGRMRGIGLVLVADDDLMVFDLDHCRDTETGVVEEGAQNIIDRLNSYTEISPSGTGVHVFVRGKLPGLSLIHI